MVVVGVVVVVVVVVVVLVVVVVVVVEPASTHRQSPRHQLGPFPCGQSAHVVAL